MGGAEDGLVSARMTDKDRFARYAEVYTSQHIADALGVYLFLAAFWESDNTPSKEKEREKRKKKKKMVRFTEFMFHLQFWE